MKNATTSSSELKEVQYNAEFREKISRLFIFRFLWVYIMVWPLMVWVVWIGIIQFVHFWHMLILGKRHEVLWQKELRFMRHVIKWGGYFSNLVDKRPKFIED